MAVRTYVPPSRAAFNALFLAWDGVETSRLRRLLNGIVAGSPEPDRSIPLRAYNVCRATESLNRRTGVSRDEMADLEIAASNYGRAFMGADVDGGGMVAEAPSLRLSWAELRASDLTGRRRVSA